MLRGQNGALQVLRAANGRKGCLGMLFSTNMNDLAKVSPKAAQFWAEHNMAALEDGSYDLGDGECVNVMSYVTKPRAEKEYEAHIEYADIQCVIAGEEYLEVAPVQSLVITQAFDEKDDYALYSNEFEGEKFLMTPGRFALVGPEDAHMPGTCVDAPEEVKKAVFKIKVASL